MGKGEGSKAQLPPTSTPPPQQYPASLEDSWWMGGLGPCPRFPKFCVPSYRTQDGSEFLLQAKDEVRSGPFSPLSGPQELPGWLVPGPE